jgi:solute carrier family 25 (mitochondrial citrate transporter), member 1
MSKSFEATIAGSIAGGIETICIWPTEYTKTLLQLQTKNEYKGIIDCARKQIIKNGPLSLYKGMSTALLFSVPKAGLRFGSYSYFQNKLSNNNNITPFVNLGAGIISGALEGAIVVTPQESIKTKLIELNSGLIKGTQTIIKEKGIKGLYRGALPTIIKQSSNQGIRFMTFGLYKNYMTNNNEKKLSPLNALFGGMFAGGISVLLNNPIDVVKTRMQGLEANKYKSTKDCITQIISKEGFKSFYRGAGARLLRVIPGQGIVFTSYEMILNLIMKSKH